MRKERELQNLVEIIETLRGKNGCPWDREQTLQSLKPCVMEEAAEVTAAIRIYETTGNYDNLREELGDLLLQVVMQSQIAKEDGIFSIEDVIAEISEKMIRRHPHVFGDVEVNKTSEVLKNWDEIKKQEKAEKTWIQTPLTEIPFELPALTRGTKVLKKIHKIYEPCISGKESIQIMKEKLEQMEQTLGDKEESSKALGELLLQICNVSREQEILPEQLLTDEIEKQIDIFERNR